MWEQLHYFVEKTKWFNAGSSGDNSVALDVSWQERVKASLNCNDILTTLVPGKLLDMKYFSRYCVDFQKLSQ